eukprot:gene28606-37803_t
MADSKLIKKTVLIIGYGTAGSKVCAQLAKSKHLKVIVLHACDFMEMPFLMTKVIAEGPGEHSKVIFPVLQEPGVEYINALATYLESDSCTTSTGQVINFDVCIVATGQKYDIFFPNPSNENKEADRKVAISSYYEKVKAANTIVIAGGGPIGVELAADIKLGNKNKKVVLVHSHEFVLDKMNAPFPSLATEALKKHGVELKLRSRAVRNTETLVYLDNDESIPCDLFISTNPPGGANAPFLTDTYKDAKGFILVNHHLQVPGLPKVLAIGDCSNRDVKGAVKINDQLPILLENVVALTQDKPLTPHVLGKSFFGKVNGPMMVSI